MFKIELVSRFHPKGMELKGKIGGSVNPEVEYLMIEKLKGNNKNAQ